MYPFTPNFLDSLCVKVARQLNQLPNELEQAEAEEFFKKGTHLILPATSAEKIRVSEQEARFLLTQQLEQYEIYYAVETPTQQRYQFKGTHGDRSASTDVTLFERSPDNGFTRKVQVKLKAHNVQLENITKDFEKLLQEKESGLFFHILEAANSGTLTSDASRKGVLLKYRNAFMDLWGKFDRKKEATWFLHFVIFCMNPAFILSKTVTAEDLCAIERFFDFQYRIIGGEINVIDNNGWSVLDFQNDQDGAG
ncbi:MAG: hypothetical protein D3910_01155 [Candidatus Electrothrix sp. ATG2]|nr:hypothetical protein [Candidatus Electrothrix sp. ATG2]